MAKRTKKPKPFDVDLTPAELAELGGDLAREIEDALSARAAVIADGGLIDLADWFYEQGRSAANERPFVGAADLTSYYITENVDAMRSRLLKAIYGVRPFCFVEGWGQDAAKAPFVEEFHDWQVRKSGLKMALANTIHGALIEDAYILEVTERVETVRTTETIKAALVLNESGGPTFEATDGGAPQPKLQMDEQGDPVPAQDGQPHAVVERTQTKTKRLGPKYTPISMKDFLFLPGHAPNRERVWGYAYRIWSRVPELLEKADDGIYDADAVKRLGDSSDRNDMLTPTPAADVAPQYGPSVEKELFQLSLKRDLDGDGLEEWYLATISLKTRELLRLQRDTFLDKVGMSRCVPFVLFPRRNAVTGYSYAFDKLLTLAEEHTALRNMKADRGALATNAPIMQVQGGLWDANTQPLGVGAIITVRDAHELTQMQVSDVPQSVYQQEQMLMQAKERVGGLSDSAVGILSGERRTLGENKLVAGGSAVRVDEVIGYLHAAIADVMTLSHAIWIESLQSNPKGVPAPSRVMQSLKARGQDLNNGRFTADQLTGDFAFEPYGSDDTADPQKRRSDFDSSLVALANLAKAFPSLVPVMQNRDAARAVLEQWMREYNVRDRQPFLGAFDAPPPPPAGLPGAPPAEGQPGMAPPVAPPGLPPVLAQMIAAH